MALNISIDVDGTLIDEMGNLIPQSEEKLAHLKSQGHRLQLWSAAGADYAREVALKHNLADLFETYAAKPDVAIDDVPESLRPVVVKVGKSFRITDAIDIVQSNRGEAMEHYLNPPLDLVRHVAEVQSSSMGIREQFPALGIRPLPIPFFGNVDHARVVTVGLNPSATEFDERGWEAVTKPDELTFRLVNYFRLAGDRFPPAHDWFRKILEAMNLWKCPPEIALAHVDFCPWATELRHTPPQFWNFIDAQMNLWLGKTIKRCKNSAKRVVIIETDNPTALQLERKERTKIIIRSVFEGEIVSSSRANLVGLPIL